jgi:hypothetical protein
MEMCSIVGRSIDWLLPFADAALRYVESEISRVASTGTRVSAAALFSSQVGVQCFFRMSLVFYYDRRKQMLASFLAAGPLV